MKKICFIFLCLAFTKLSFSQKQKDKLVSFKHVKAPLTPISDMIFEYDFIVREENMDNKGVKTTLGVTSGTSAYDARSNFYKGLEGLGRINGFVVLPYGTGADHPNNRLIFNVGVIDVSTKDVVQNGELQGTLTPALCYQIKFSLPMVLRFNDPYGNYFYYKSSLDNKELFTYRFPVDYKPTSGVKGYATAVELETAYQTHRTAFLLEARNQIVKNWIYETKMDISSRFAYQVTDAKVDINTVKVKKGSYDDIDKLAAEMDTLFALLDREHTSGIKTNWHTSYYKNAFANLASNWEKIWSIENEKLKSGQPARVEQEALDGLYKNVLWCKFFAGEMDFVIAKATELETYRIENPKKFYSIRYDQMLAFITDYKLRYEANKNYFEQE